MIAAAAAVRPTPISKGPVLILAALPEEISPLFRRTTIARRMTFGRCRAGFGRLEGIPVVLATTGDGATLAQRGVEALLDSVPVARVLIIGLAGALTRSLEIGRVVVARDLVENGSSVPPPDPVWLARAVDSAGITSATLLSSATILGSPDAKARALETLPAGTPAAVVDLESATFARAAAKRGIPYLSLRSISDTADESFVIDFNSLRARDGSVDRFRVALRALRSPSLVAPLWRLRRRTSLCSQNLARAALAVLSGGAG